MELTANCCLDDIAALIESADMLVSIDGTQAHIAGLINPEEHTRYRPLIKKFLQGRRTPARIKNDVKAESWRTLRTLGRARGQHALEKGRNRCKCAEWAGVAKRRPSSTYVNVDYGVEPWNG